MKQLLRSLVCTVALLGANAMPASAQHGDQDKKVPAIVSFGVGLNTATPNNPPNHRVHPQDIHIETGNVVNFLVAGFHQIFIYKPGVTLDQIVAPGSGTFVDQHLDLLYYRGLVPAGGPPPGLPVTTDPSNASNRAEPVGFFEPGVYLVICNIRGHFLDGMIAYVRVTGPTGQ
jgi:hypothetical protein